MSESNTINRSEKPQIAVLITCHNRRDTTIACLRALYEQDVNFAVYLVDDGSTDGTSDAVKTHYPAVKLLQGDGNLFWCGGMRKAFAEALKEGYDYYLWLNDDTILEPKAISKLLDIHRDLTKRGDRDSIIAGSTRDSNTGKPTYGGAVRSKRWYSNKFEFLKSTSKLQECDTMHGNCVLIPHSVVKKVGNIDGSFTHQRGDIDYGLRARQQNCSVWLAPGYVGNCDSNKLARSWADTELSLYKRFQKVIGPKAFPINEWTIFTRRHSGVFWFFYWTLPYIRAIIGYKNFNTSSILLEESKTKN